VDRNPGATFGQRLKAFRLAAGLTKAELGKRARVFATAVGSYEAGRQYPRDARRERLAKALGVTVERLGVGSDRPMRWGEEGRGSRNFLRTLVF
jgi:transcriptional regulator with XRE-family HTH domain